MRSYVRILVIARAHPARVGLLSSGRADGSSRWRLRSPRSSPPLHMRTRRRSGATRASRIRVRARPSPTRTPVQRRAARPGTRRGAAGAPRRRVLLDTGSAWAAPSQACSSGELAPLWAGHGLQAPHDRRSSGRRRPSHGARTVPDVGMIRLVLTGRPRAASRATIEPSLMMFRRALYVLPGSAEVARGSPRPTRLRRTAARWSR
jgi:hypothetical protein